MAHTHAHSHGPANYGRAFALGVVLNTGFVILEATYGYWSNSLALIADAGHNLSDVLSLLLAWGAAWLAQRQVTQYRTYGFRRSSILAALLNAVLLLIAIGGIAWEAIQRFDNPEPLAAGTVIWVAAVGIAINTATALLFVSGRKGDLNIRGAFLHMAADAGVSLGVVISGITIAATGWTWLDPVTSLIIVVVIFIGTWGLLRESVNLALDAVPEGVDMQRVQEYLTRLQGVQSVHDLHVWAMSTTETALTAHLIIPEATFTDEFLDRAAKELHDRFGIEHTTLQVETGNSNHRCHSCGPTHRYELREQQTAD
jgi:cobalt-zinc-cadmium efflux system protein